MTFYEKWQTLSIHFSFLDEWGYKSKDITPILFVDYNNKNIKLRTSIVVTKYFFKMRVDESL